MNTNAEIGMNLYTFREHCKTEADLANTLERLRKIGYVAIQVSGIGPIPPTRVKELLDGNGQVCCATHERLDAYEERFDEVIEKLAVLECDFTALGHPGKGFDTPEAVVDLCARLEKIGARFREKGITFGYHNHAMEFEKFSGKILLEEILTRTKPDHVHFELDLHWVARGGGSPAHWMKKIAGRAHAIHMKDFLILGGNPVFAEVGEGNLDWDEILPLCRKAGTRWYIVEQDQPFGDRDIFESAKITYDNMRKMGLK
ncbi:MAG: sugar phosphate isomerase/epimerase [Spirochaetaceae bacterium]|nr:MAG: sugar phosphate isomerase/epimerase [Spirochaetaceae bacterium]